MNYSNDQRLWEKLEITSGGGIGDDQPTIDIDSLVIVGSPGLDWMRPRCNLQCMLRDTQAQPWTDVKAIASLVREKKLHPWPTQSWICFKLGGCKDTSIYYYALVENERGEPNAMADYRKDFFDEYVFKALRNDADGGGGGDAAAAAAAAAATHAELANGNKSLPSEGNLYIYEQSWSLFTARLEKMLRLKLPRNTVYLFAGLTMHGLKSDLRTGFNNLVTMFHLCIDDERKPDQIYLCQMHVAALLQRPKQLITADHSTLGRFLPSSSFVRYEAFGMTKKGNFTSVKNDVLLRFDDDDYVVDYLQFYYENFHLLKKGGKENRCSFFMDQAFGDFANFHDQLPRNEPYLPTFAHHRKNLESRRRQIQTFLESVRRGVAARFEVVFTSKKMANFFAAAGNPRRPIASLRQLNDLLADAEAGFDYRECSFYRNFLQILLSLLRNECIQVSKGRWWSEALCPYVEKNFFRPLTAAASAAVPKPFGIDHLNSTYDREQALMLFCYGSWQKRNKSLDNERQKFVRSIFERLAIVQDKVEQLPLPKADDPPTRTEAQTKLSEYWLSVAADEGQRGTPAHGYATTCLALERAVLERNKVKAQKFAETATGPEAVDVQSWYNPSYFHALKYPSAVTSHVRLILDLAAAAPPRSAANASPPPPDDPQLFLNVLRDLHAYVATRYRLRQLRLADENAFSDKTFKAASTTKSKRVTKLYAYRYTCTVDQVLQSILHPATAIGQILLCRHLQARKLLEWRRDRGLQNKFMRLLRVSKVSYFPTILLNPAKVTHLYKHQRWNYWCKLQMDMLTCQMTSSTEAKPKPPQLVKKPFDPRSNLRQYQNGAKLPPKKLNHRHTKSKKFQKKRRPEPPQTNVDQAEPPPTKETQQGPPAKAPKLLESKPAARQSDKEIPVIYL